MQLVMVGNQHQRSYGTKTQAQNTINLGQISGKMKTWNNFILRPILRSLSFTQTKYFTCFIVHCNVDTPANVICIYISESPWSKTSKSSSIARTSSTVNSWLGCGASILKDTKHDNLLCKIDYSKYYN